MTREEITGNHHVDITRDENGTISLYFDMIQLFSINDKSVNFSEKFQLVSVLGGVAFDNIRISNVVEEIDPPTVSSSSSSSSQESTLPSSSSTNEDESSENDDNPISLTVWVISFLALLIIRKRPN